MTKHKQMNIKILICFFMGSHSACGLEISYVRSPNCMYGPVILSPAIICITCEC